eukprot:TRINITY_DN115195_c0_g1_i1.p1 TRINITY_DN115195_c0_g1~~TRINITY_DN115195_c0_g1_i1.p1  ORF type:complete len:114 (-),score=11.64 TRINITY_DN115195_c0_g1_i1:57-398(-)
MLDIVGGAALIAIVYRGLRVVNWASFCSCLTGEDELLSPPPPEVRRKSRYLEESQRRQTTRGTQSPISPTLDDTGGSTTKSSRSRFKASSSRGNLGEEGPKPVLSRRGSQRLS